MKRTRNSIDDFKVLTNDPSMTAWGWAVVTPSGKVIEVGAIKTEPTNKKLHIRKGDDRVRRLGEISNQLLEVIKKHKIAYILSELPHGSQSAVAAVMVGAVTGLLQAVSVCLDIGIEWYSEGDSKKSISGRRSVGKDEMVALIDQFYEIPWKGIKWHDQAVADAMAVFHVADQQSSILKVMR